MRECARKWALGYISRCGVLIYKSLGISDKLKVNEMESGECTSSSQESVVSEKDAPVSVKSSLSTQDSAPTISGGVIARSRMGPWEDSEASSDDEKKKGPEKKRLKKTKRPQTSKSSAGGSAQSGYYTKQHGGDRGPIVDFNEEVVDKAISMVTNAAKALAEPGGSNDMGIKEIITVSSGEEDETNVPIKIEKDTEETAEDKFDRTKEAVSKSFETIRKRIRKVIQVEEPLDYDPTKKKFKERRSEPSVSKSKKMVLPGLETPATELEGTADNRSEPTVSKSKKTVLPGLETSTTEPADTADNCSKPSVNKAKKMVLPGPETPATEPADTADNVEEEEVREQGDIFDTNVRVRTSLVVPGSEASNLVTSLGQPWGIPTLLVKFFGLNEEAECLAETLLKFDHDRGDLVGDIQSNGVKVGIYIEVRHCDKRDEVYKLRDMLKGIEGTFYGSSIIPEIK